MVPDRSNITILGDSRAFDTYYLNDRYDQFYGYDKTFPFLLRSKVLSKRDGKFDVVHIPDHFRGGSVKNNILRIAMTDPVMVYLIDGIWETLLNKEHFSEYAADAIKNHNLRSGVPLELELSNEKLVQLFENDKLSVSPTTYANRIRRIASFLRRRQRACTWLNLIRPKPTYRDRIHYAGNYRCSPVWNTALSAVNLRVGEAIRGLDVSIIDLHRLMEAFGGEESSLIDQWHFTSEFHALIASELQSDVQQRETDLIVPADHISHRHMLPNKNSGDPIVVYGNTAVDWVKANPEEYVTGIASSEMELAETQADIIMLCYSNSDERERLAERMLSIISVEKIILFPEEAEGIDNPPIGS